MSSSIVTPVPDGLLSQTDTPYSKLVCCSKVCIRYKISESPSQCSSMAILIFLDSWFNNVSSPAVYIVVFSVAAVLYSGRIVK